MRRRLIRSVLAVAIVVGGLAVGGASSASAAGTGGYDNPSCHPSAAHPSPVVLLHGLGGNGPGNVGPLALQLAAAGYCTFDLTYGEEAPGIPVGGLVDLDQSAAQIKDFIEQVRAETGAAKVDIIGHSEGGFQSLYVPKELGIAGQVDKVVALAPPTHGTTFAGLVSVANTLQLRNLVNQVLNQFGCAACDELIAGGSGVVRLDDGPIAQPGISYTVIASRTDELVTPHQSATTAETAFINEPGVTNEYVQNYCPFDPVGHIGLAYDLDVENMVANALDPAHAGPVTCSVGLPF
ncbi:MAG TPA: alpha/beta fold hydrolase [Pseudonocardiaceae bacterium]|nr:alpha/beta fold hydrolase [Pseudonocardiaceae bacterium]